MLSPFLQWMESTGIASAIAQSTMLTGLLSAAHLLGLTLLVGGALVSGLRLLGLLLHERPAPEVLRTTVRGMSLGLGISVTTGLFLFSARASSAGVNPTFRLKMLLLVVAASFHFLFYRQLGGLSQSTGVLRLKGGLALILWFGVAFAGCAYILFE